MTDSIAYHRTVPVADRTEALVGDGPLASPLRSPARGMARWRDPTVPKRGTRWQLDEGYRKQ